MMNDFPCLPTAGLTQVLSILGAALRWDPAELGPGHVGGSSEAHPGTGPVHTCGYLA